MASHLRHPLIISGSLIALLLVLLACGSTGSIAGGSPATATVLSTATATLVPMATATLVPTATHTPPTATPASLPGVCNAADFPTKTNGGPDYGFAYPPLTYYAMELPGAGNLPYALCSPGTPSTILVEVKSKFPTAGWKIIGSTGSGFSIEKPTAPPSGFCYSIDFTFGIEAGYPGEWEANHHPPALAC